MKKLVPLLMCSLLSVSSAFTPILAEGEDETEEISEESEEKTVDDTYTGLRILFTNDLQDHILPHKKAQTDGSVKEVGGYARLASAIDQYKVEDNTILIDGGDFSTGTTFNALYESDAPDLTLLGMMGYDVIALGEKDLNYGVDSFAQMVSMTESTPTLLIDNIEYADNKSGRACKTILNHQGASTYKVLDKAGIKVGIFSVVNDEIFPDGNLIPSSEESDKQFVKNMVQTLQETEGVDYIIAIVHGGESFTKKMAEISGIDTIISSCEVEEINALEDSEVNIVSSGENGDYLGVLDIDPDTKNVDNYTLVSIDEAFANREDINNKVNEYNDKINSLLFTGYDLSKNSVQAENAYNFSEIEHYSKELSNNNTADLITDAYAYAYEEWYADWYTEWKAKRRQMLKAAQSVLDKENAEKEATAQEEAVTEETPVEETVTEEVPTEQTVTEETPSAEVTAEENTEATSEDTAESTEENVETSQEETEITQSEAEKRLEEVQNMSPGVKKVAIGLISKKEIQGTFTKDSITASDAFNVVSKGKGADGSIGESLVLVFMKGSDIRTLCEYDATVGRSSLSESENQLYFSGLKYTYDDFRGDYNHVEEVYVDAVNGYYIPIQNDELYPVVTTLSLAQELPELTRRTNLTKVVYYDENGGTIQKLGAHILTYGKKEMKSYKIISDYVEQLERNKRGSSEIPSDYKISRTTKKCNTEFSLISYFKNTTSAVLKGYLTKAIGIGALIIVILCVTKYLTYRKEKKEETQESKEEDKENE